MKSLAKAMFLALTLFVISAFKVEDCEVKPVLLVLTDTNNEDSFSKFSITEQGGILVGENVDDYPVQNGIYRIHGSSNDKYYNHNILIVNN